MRDTLMRIIFALILMAVLYSSVSCGDEGAPVALAQIGVAVPDRSPAALDNALQTAFEKQLVQMSGNPNIMMQVPIQAASKNVRQWVETYGYTEQPNQATGAPPTLMLQVTFDETALQKLLGEGKSTVAEKTLLDRATVADQKTIDVVVTHIEDMKDLANVLTALRGVYGVKEVSPKDIQSDRATVTLTFSGDAARFENQISNDYRFRAGSKSLEYEWVGREP
jgi:hypothetical protein